jgi:hypothetical protein
MIFPRSYPNPARSWKDLAKILHARPCQDLQPGKCAKIFPVVKAVSAPRDFRSRLVTSGRFEECILNLKPTNTSSKNILVSWFFRFAFASQYI